MDNNDGGIRSGIAGFEPSAISNISPLVEPLPVERQVPWALARSDHGGFPLPSPGTKPVSLAFRIQLQKRKHCDGTTCLKVPNNVLDLGASADDNPDCSTADAADATRLIGADDFSLECDDDRHSGRARGAQGRRRHGALGAISSIVQSHGVHARGECPRCGGLGSTAGPHLEGEHPLDARQALGRTPSGRRKRHFLPARSRSYPHGQRRSPHAVARNNDAGDGGCHRVLCFIPANLCDQGSAARIRFCSPPHGRHERAR